MYSALTGGWGWGLLPVSANICIYKQNWPFALLLFVVVGRFGLFPVIIRFQIVIFCACSCNLDFIQGFTTVYIKSLFQMCTIATVLNIKSSFHLLFCFVFCCFFSVITFKSLQMSITFALLILQSFTETVKEPCSITLDLLFKYSHDPSVYVQIIGGDIYVSLLLIKEMHIKD